MATSVERASGRASKKLSGKEGGAGSPQQSKAAGAGKEASPAGSNSPLQKLKFCMYHLQGVCKYSGNSCPFAHSIEEIHQARGRKRPVRRGISRNAYQGQEDQLKANMSDQQSPSGSQSGTPPREGRAAGPGPTEPMFVKSFTPQSVHAGTPNSMKKEPGAVPGIGQHYALQAQVLSLLDGMEKGQGGCVDKPAMAGMVQKDPRAGLGGAISEKDFQDLSRSIGSLASILSNLHYSADQIMASNACHQGHHPFPMGGLPPGGFINTSPPPYPQLPVLTPDLPAAFAAAALGACSNLPQGCSQVDSALLYRPEVPLSAGLAGGFQIPVGGMVDNALFGIGPPPGL